MIAAASIAGAICLAISIALLLRGITVTVFIIRKETNMATIKERLAALEANKLDTSTLATKDELAAVTAQVNAITSEIGTDPEPAPVDQHAAPFEAA